MEHIFPEIKGKVVLELDAEMCVWLNRCFTLANLMGMGEFRAAFETTVEMSAMRRDIGVKKIESFERAFLNSCKAAMPGAEVQDAVTGEAKDPDEPCRGCHCEDREECCYCGKVHPHTRSES